MLEDGSWQLAGMHLSPDRSTDADGVIMMRESLVKLLQFLGIMPRLRP